jgi:hypothetical protein
VLTGAIDAISGNAYSNALKANSYDSYYHLCIQFQTNNGIVFAEKNEGVLVGSGNKRTAKSQVYPLPNFPHITIREVIENVRRVQGSNIFKYSANSNNCQRFVADLLRGCGIQDAGAFAFVQQDTQSIFRGHEGLRKIANTVTDLAGIAQNVRQIPRLLQRKAEQLTGINKVTGSIKNKVKKFFGFGFGMAAAKMKVADLKAIIKSHKKHFGRKILITGLKKKDLVALVTELEQAGFGQE